jgi:serine protease Do
MHRRRTRIGAPLLLSLALLPLPRLDGCKARTNAASSEPPLSEPVKSGATPVASEAPLPSPAPGVADVSALFERVKPVVVNITTKQEVSVEPLDGLDFFAPRGRERFEQIGIGSGFITDAAGYVVTNEHVVHDADEVRVRLADEREFDARVVGRDRLLDLALLRINGASGLPAARLGSSGATKVGEPVVAVGNPFGLGHTVTGGIISAKERAIGLGPYDDFIQTDASINPGNSGGPLFNLHGEVVGINTAIRAGANGIGFAIPVDALKEVLPALREKGHVERGKLGLGFQRLTPDLAKALGLDSPEGALVVEVEPGGPAERAGIRPGDVIIAIDGTPVRQAEELPRQVARRPPGSRIAVTVLRNGKRIELSATLSALKDDAARDEQEGKGAAPENGLPAGKLGIRVEDLPGGQGVRVIRIEPGASVGDLSEGDVIVELGGTKIHNVNELRAAIERARPGTTVLAKVRRGDASRFVALPIP